MKGKQYDWDFKVANALCPITDVLTRWDIELKEGKDGELRGDCPLPTHEGSGKNSLVVYPKANSWKCYAPKCKAARKDEDKFTLRPVDFVAAAEGITSLEAAKHLFEWFNIPKGSTLDSVKPAKEAPVQVVKEAPVARPASEVVNIKAERFMETLDKDLDQKYREILAKLESESAGNTPEERFEVVITLLKKDVKARILQSYRNGKDASKAVA